MRIQIGATPADVRPVSIEFSSSVSIKLAGFWRFDRSIAKFRGAALKRRARALKGPTRESATNLHRDSHVD